MHQAWYKT